MFMNLALMRRIDWTKVWIDELNSGRHSKKDYLKVRSHSNLLHTKLPDQNLVNAVATNSPALIGFIGYEWNFQEKDNAAPRNRQLMLSMFSEINIFHGNDKYFAKKMSSVMQLVWWMVCNLWVNC
jgi:L,D-peptidoglycan transpeptidase YkuD (ErfK/YbiS/YcfS/YnhG family)